MSIVCPYCEKKMNLKGAKPGQYKPKCSACGRPFLLVVPADEGQRPVVKGLVKKKPASGQQAATKVSAAPQSAPAPQNSAANTQAAIDATLPAAAPAPTQQPASPSPAAVHDVTQPMAGTGTVVSQTMPVPQSSPTPAGSGAKTVAEGHEATQLVDPSVSPTRVSAQDGQQSSAPVTLNQTLGGYKLVGELGRGAMGAVYHAKQLSLDRDVALKVIQPQFASNPVFIARFTREAYAAAQLTHHNVVQIYDLGAEGYTNFFSMEFVRGETLADLVQRSGKLDVEAAVGFVLQAARGLQFAHNQGMVHRDVKPGNMMINTDGIVKVADLGLVKTANMDDIEDDGAAGKDSPSAHLIASTAEVTTVNIAMGTPAYMAPEQGENAAGVDHRADIYSLGCTLYTLLTGAPPFRGNTAIEVMSKHKTEPLVRPETIVKRVPKQLSDVIMKMVAKNPDDRYQDLGVVIQDLENLLGVQSGGPFSPTEEHADTLEKCIAQFNGSSMAKVHSLMTMGFFASVSALTLISLLFSWQFSGGVVCMGAAAIVSYFITSGMRDRTYLFDKFRSMVWENRIVDWLTWIGGGCLFVLAIVALGMIWYVLPLSILGVAMGIGFHFVVDAGVAKQRLGPIETIEKMLRDLRLKGVQEDALRQFVAKYGGHRWEAFFEALFGYESKLVAREELGRTEQGRRNRKYRGWREPLIRWLDSKIRASRDRKERKHLEKVEAANLQAQGMSAAEARGKAQLMADALLDAAAETRVMATQASQVQNDPGAARIEKRARQKAMLEEARSGKYAKRGLLASLSSLLAIAAGPKVRFLLGSLLIAGCVLWMRQVGMLSGDKVIDVIAEGYKSGADGVVGTISTDVGEKSGADDALEIPMLGRINLFHSLNPGGAGLILVFSALFAGWRMSIFVLPAAVIICFGEFMGIPGIDAIGGVQMSAFVIGLAVAVVGLFFGRVAEE